MSVELLQGLETKLALLDEKIRAFPRVAVAFSGGVDSTALLHACVRVLGPSRVLAVTADSESLPQAEKEEALALARSIGAAHRLVRTMELESPEYRRNDGERCYFCKKELFSTMERIAREEGLTVLAYGAIADDALDYRPGSRAAKEFRVEAPLQEAGLSKEEIREYSARHGLPTASKSSFACLSSRVARGVEVTPEVLARIERAEHSLRRLGYRQYRVRHFGSFAKIEVSAEETERLVSRDGVVLARELREQGYEKVGVDLRGYRDPSQAALVSLETPFWSSVGLPGPHGLRQVISAEPALRDEISARLRRGDFPASPLVWSLS